MKKTIKSSKYDGHLTLQETIKKKYYSKKIGFITEFKKLNLNKKFCT